MVYLNCVFVLQLSKGEPMDIDLGGTLPPGSQGEMVPPLASPRRTDHVPQSPVRQHSSTSQAVTANSQGSNESALVSLLSQRSTKDSKQIRRPSNNEQEMSSTKVAHMKSFYFTVSCSWVFFYVFFTFFKLFHIILYGKTLCVS